jgi:hypothetical protein
VSGKLQPAIANKRDPEVTIEWHEDIDPRRRRRVAEILLDIIDTACGANQASTSDGTPEEAGDP